MNPIMNVIAIPRMYAINSYLYHHYNVCDYYYFKDCCFLDGDKKARHPYKVESVKRKEYVMYIVCQEIFGFTNATF